MEDDRGEINSERRTWVDSSKVRMIIGTGQKREMNKTIIR